MKRTFAFALLLALLLTVCGGGTAFAWTVETCFTLEEGDEVYIEEDVFEGTVRIIGDKGLICFTGCEFRGDIIIESTVSTKVFLLGCTVDGRCVFDNGLQEGSMDTDFPKVLTDSPVEAVTLDCYGSVFALGDFEIIYNGETYTIADSELFLDNTKLEEGFVPYVGQEAHVFYVGQWWENGEPVLFLECEYDPG